MELHEKLVGPSDARSAFRSQMGKISRQSSVFLAGTVFTLVGGYLFKIYTARALGAEALGFYALGSSILALFSLFANLGLPRVMVRFIPAYVAQKEWQHLRSLLWTGLGLIGLVSTALGAGMALTAGWISTAIFSKPELGGVIFLLAILVPVGTLGFLLDQVMIGFQQTARAKSLASFVTFPLLVGLTIILLSFRWGLWGYLAATILSSLVGLILLAILVWQQIPLAARQPDFSPTRVQRSVGAYAGSLVALSLWAFLAGEADKFIMGLRLDAASIGIYAVALTAAGFIPILLTTINSIFAPVIADLHTRGERKLLEELFQTLTKWTAGLTIPLFLVIFLFASEFMRIFGTDFERGARVLQIIGVGQLVNIGTGSVGYMLLMSGHETLLVRNQIVASIAAFLLYVLLIPPLGVVGAAIGQGMSAIVYNLANLYFVQREMGMSPYNRAYLRIGPAILLTTLSLLVLRWAAATSSEVHVILAAAAIGYFFFIILALLVGLDENDRFILAVAADRVRAIRGRL